MAEPIPFRVIDGGLDKTPAELIGSGISVALEAIRQGNLDDADKLLQSILDYIKTLVQAQRIRKMR